MFGKGVNRTKRIYMKWDHTNEQAGTRKCQPVFILGLKNN